MKVYHKLSGEFPYACVSLWLLLFAKNEKILHLK